MRRVSRHLFEICSGADRKAPVAVHFPYAGGGIYALRDFAAVMPQRRHLAVNYPARGALAADPAAGSIEEIAADVATEYLLATARTEPAAGPMLIGHSMGGYVALEAAARLGKAGTRCSGIVVSSSRPPRTAAGAPDPRQLLGGQVVADLDDDELAAVLVDEGGLPSAITDEKDLLEAILPPLRHDFMLGAEYAKRGPAGPVPFPIVAVGGADDANVPPESLPGWRPCTSACFAARTWPGGHFWFRSRPEDLAAFVLGALDTGPVGG